MSFTVQDFGDLTRLIEDHPEWRSELRRLLLSDELLTLPQAVRELIAAQRRTEERLQRLEAAVEGLAEAQRRTEERVAGLAEVQQRGEDRLSRLEEAIQDLVREVRALVVSLSRTQDTVGDMKGRLLELTYKEKVGGYFGHLLRRVRVVELTTLEDALESNLSPGEFREVFRLDLLASGRPRIRPEEPEVFLAVEVSSVVDQNDVDRAERRAKLLQQAGYRVLPVAAGEQITRGAEESARVQKVVLLRDGQALFWEEALEFWAA